MKQVRIILWSQLLQAYMNHMWKFFNRYHTEYKFLWFWLWMILGDAIFLYLKEITLKAVDFSILSYFSKIKSYNSALRENFTTSPMWSGVKRYAGRLISLFQIACMCLILLNIDIFLGGFSSIYFTPFRLWWCGPCYILLYIFDWRQTCCSVVGYFIPIMRIQTLVVFIIYNDMFRGILLFDWEM